MSAAVDAQNYISFVVNGLLDSYHRLLTTEGSLLACAGYGEKDKHVAAALAGNIWMSYTKNAEVILDNDPLSLIMVQCMVRTTTAID